MIKKKFTGCLLITLFLFLVLLVLTGCSPDPVAPEEPLDIEEPESADTADNDEDEAENEAEEPQVEAPHSSPNHYWPYLNLGILELSSGEIIAGPDLFESELGFIAEFTEEYSYAGKVYWLVQDTDVFEIDWVALSFIVEYYEEFEWQYELTYDLIFDELEPEPADDGAQEFIVNLTDSQEGFEIIINRIILGKEQEGSFTTDPINYVALDIVLQVVPNP